MDFVDGVGEPALQNADLAEKRSSEGEFVTRVVGCANGAEWHDEYVEGGEVVK